MEQWTSYFMFTLILHLAQMPSVTLVILLNSWLLVLQVLCNVFFFSVFSGNAWIWFCHEAVLVLQCRSSVSKWENILRTDTFNNLSNLFLKKKKILSPVSSTSGCVFFLVFLVKNPHSLQLHAVSMKCLTLWACVYGYIHLHWNSKFCYLFC